MTALAQTEVPPARVAAQPRSVDLIRQHFCPREPMMVEVDPLFKVDVEEMIGRRQPRRRPPPNNVIKAAFEVGAVFVEVNEVGIALLHPASVNTIGGDFEFTGKPDA